MLEEVNHKSPYNLMRFTMRQYCPLYQTELAAELRQRSLPRSEECHLFLNMNFASVLQRLTTEGQFVL